MTDVLDDDLKTILRNRGFLYLEFDIDNIHSSTRKSLEKVTAESKGFVMDAIVVAITQKAKPHYSKVANVASLITDEVYLTSKHPSSFRAIKLSGVFQLVRAVHPDQTVSILRCSNWAWAIVSNIPARLRYHRFSYGNQPPLEKNPKIIVFDINDHPIIKLIVKDYVDACNKDVKSSDIGFAVCKRPSEHEYKAREKDRMGSICRVKVILYAVTRDLLHKPIEIVGLFAIPPLDKYKLKMVQSGEIDAYLKFYESTILDEPEVIYENVIHDKYPQPPYPDTGFFLKREASPFDPYNELKRKFTIEES